MEAIPKIGILVGIVAISIALPFWIIMTVAENEKLIAEVFFDEDLVLNEFKNTDTYKAMIERYPDSYVEYQANPMHSSLELIMYGEDSALSVHLGMDQFSGSTWESAHCRIQDSQLHSKLGKISDADVDVPEFVFKDSHADQAFASTFVTFTNCLELEKEQEDLQKLDADHHIAIPENTGTPECAEDLSCFEPYSIKIKAGDVVSFRNFDSNMHTVTHGIPEMGPGNEFDSGLMESGGTFVHEFTESGEYEYFCMVHPWQTGKIIVHEK